MAVITLTAAPGAPGVTTTAMGLLVVWPREVLLVEADPSAAQAMATGYLRTLDLAGRGLSSLARAHREQLPLAQELPLHWVDVDTGAADPRHVLAGFSHPGGASLFKPAWPVLADALVGLGERDCDVLMDCGRLPAEGLPSAPVASSDLVVCCVRSSLRALAALRLHLPTLQAQLEQSGSAAELVLLVIGPDRPYTTREIEAQFGVPVLTSIAWDARQAEVFSDGATPGRSWGGSSLVRSLRTCASTMTTRIQRRREVVAGSRDVSQWVRP